MRGTSLGWGNCPKCNKDFVPATEECKCLICRKEIAKVIETPISVKRTYTTQMLLRVLFWLQKQVTVLHLFLYRTVKRLSQ
jgi:hypothetical protein